MLSAKLRNFCERRSELPVDLCIINVCVTYGCVQTLHNVFLIQCITFLNTSALFCGIPPHFLLLYFRTNKSDGFTLTFYVK